MTAAMRGMAFVAGLPFMPAEAGTTNDIYTVDTMAALASPLAADRCVDGQPVTHTSFATWRFVDCTQAPGTGPGSASKTMLASHNPALPQ